MRPRLPRPTDTELSILRVLWDHGPSTVRQVHETMAKDRTVGYTTTLKLLQIMTEKGLVTRQPATALAGRAERSHVYQAKLQRADAQRQLVGDLLDRAFGGSAATLVMQALASHRATDDELQQIRRLIDQHEEKGHGRD